MCGIFGVLDRKKIDFNRNLLPHRGPDDWGYTNYKVGDKYLNLFQSRLSILGLGEQGHQPYKKYDKYALLYNGEIYNYKQIKQLLENNFNINFISKTDTEVLYESIIRFGIEETLDILDGIFAFSFYNHDKKKLYLVRDHLGVKPLYYYKSNQK